MNRDDDDYVPALKLLVGGLIAAVVMYVWVLLVSSLAPG